MKYDYLAKKYSICFAKRNEYLQIIQNVSILIFLISKLG